MPDGKTHATQIERSWPVFDAEMIEAAMTVLRTGKVNYWTGPEGKCFEGEFARLHGVPYAVTLSNGTTALDLAIRALGIGPGDDVIISPRSFIATASCVVASGARPVFADVDRDSGNVRADTIEAAWTPATRAIIAVHLGGWPCDLDPIMELARARGIRVVEDVAQAMGGTYGGRPLGAIGDTSTFSLCNDKIVSTGEGGMLVTTDEDIFKRVWALRDNGRDWDAAHIQTDAPGFKWTRGDFGTNGRMTEMQSAIGRVALRRLPDWIAIRRRNARLLARRLSEAEVLRIPTEPDGHAYYRSYVYVRPERLAPGWTRDRILAELLKRNLSCSVGSCAELYMEKAFDRHGLRPEKRLPVAQGLGETSLALPVHPTLTENDIHEMADVMLPVFDAATA